LARKSEVLLADLLHAIGSEILQVFNVVDLRRKCGGVRKAVGNTIVRGRVAIEEKFVWSKATLERPGP
jgi:hypothetical protein